MADFEWAHELPGFDPNNPFSGDERLPVRFFMKEVEDPDATLKEGRPIYRMEDAIEIIVSKDEIVVHVPPYDSDKRRWPRQYAAWKQTGNNKPGMMGLPLDKWPQVTPAMVKELEYFKVYTLEQLAELPATTIQRVPGLQQLVNQAKVHMEIARGEAPMHRLNKELEKLGAERDEERRQKEALVKRLEVLEALAAKKREIA